MQRQLGFNYSQQFLDHDYKELCIPPTADGKFAMPDTSSLHIWYVLVRLVFTFLT